MTALAITSAPRFPRLLNWSRVSAWSGSLSLHVLLALLLLVPPLAMQVQRIILEKPTYVDIIPPPPEVKPEPAMPQPPVKIKKVAPAPPRPTITINAPIPNPLPPTPPTQTNSITPPSDTPAPPVHSDGGAGDAVPSALAYGTQTRIPYPMTALRNRTEGTVVLRVLVGEDGSVKEIEVDKSSGSRDLDRAAREAVMKWKFKPGMRSGVAYAGWARVPINFTLP